jgi:hypothetical protein
MGRAISELWPGRGTAQRAASFSLLVALALVVLCLPAKASAAQTHTFDALLSLTGGTGTSKVDSVPDPGPAHPASTFFETLGAAVDSAGDVYVSSYGTASSGENGRVDIFDPAGAFLTSVLNEEGPGAIAVGSTGTLYVEQEIAPHKVVRYTPSAFPPTASTTYGSPTAVAPGEQPSGLAVNPADDHLFLSLGDHISEYSSAESGNSLIDDTIGAGLFKEPRGIAVDAKLGRLYVGAVPLANNLIPSPSEPFVSVIYVFDLVTGDLLSEVTGSDTPNCAPTPGGTECGFSASFGRLYPGVDEETGEVFVNDVAGSGEVFRFVPDSGNSYEYAADPESESHSYAPFSATAVSNGESAPNKGYVFISSSSLPIAHLFAFGPAGELGPPLVSETSFSGVTTSEVVLSAELNPGGAATQYRFEYVDDATYRQDVEQAGPEHGFDHALATTTEELPAGTQDVAISANLSGLSPGTIYHFRVYAVNHCNTVELEAECVAEGEREEEGVGDEIPHLFATFAESPAQGPCPNEQFRTGPSGFLPDCRAYELVSPVFTGGHPASAASLGANYGSFATEMVSPDGARSIFEAVGGSIPGTDGNGFADRYLSTRSASGWTTTTESPNGSQSENPFPGGASSDLLHTIWTTGGGLAARDEGSLVLGDQTSYLHLPDGTFVPLGQGSLGLQTLVEPLWISAGAAHTIFASETPIETGAPPAGLTGIYDRTGNGALHVVSLLPGAQVPTGASNVSYQGVSADGRVVAFTVTEAGVRTLYLRVDNSQTIPVETGETIFAGLSTNGGELTYEKGGNLFRFDAGSLATTPIGSGGQSLAVNVSADGSNVYFVSRKNLAPGGKGGQENLYVWDEAGGVVSFIAIVTADDVAGEPSEGAVNLAGLGLWSEAAVSPFQGSLRGPGNDPSRTSPDGRFFVFESAAGLTAGGSGGHRQVYRYDSASGNLDCVSCPPDLSPPTSDAKLQTIDVNDKLVPTNSLAVIHNVTDDGGMVFFESAEALVPTDVNGERDVYEWEQQGIGGCDRSPGCLSLVSLGRGPQPSYLYGVTPGGGDALFTTSDALLPIPGVGGTPTLYDARIDGGFPIPTEPAGCQLDGCQPSQAPPGVVEPSSSQVVGPGNVKPKHPKRCKKTQRRVKRHGKVRCVSKKHHGKQTAGKNRGGSR